MNINNTSYRQRFGLVFPRPEVKFSVKLTYNYCSKQKKWRTQWEIVVFTAVHPNEPRKERSQKGVIRWPCPRNVRVFEWDNFFQMQRAQNNLWWLTSRDPPREDEQLGELVGEGDKEKLLRYQKRKIRLKVKWREDGPNEHQNTKSKKKPVAWEWEIEPWKRST